MVLVLLLRVLRGVVVLLLVLVMTTERPTRLVAVPMQSLAFLQTRLVGERRSPPEDILRLLMLLLYRLLVKHLELSPAVTVAVAAVERGTLVGAELVQGRGLVSTAASGRWSRRRDLGKERQGGRGGSSRLSGSSIDRVQGGDHTRGITADGPFRHSGVLGGGGNGRRHGRLLLLLLLQEAM
jgi:hypothetical protein